MHRKYKYLNVIPSTYIGRITDVNGDVHYTRQHISRHGTYTIRKAVLNLATRLYDDDLLSDNKFNEIYELYKINKHVIK